MHTQVEELNKTKVKGKDLFKGRLKILFISYPFPPYGGMTRRPMFFANQLTEWGHTVHVLSIMPSSYLSNYDEALSRQISPDVRVHRVPSGILHHLRYRGKRWFEKIKLDNLLSLLSTLEWLPYGFWGARGLLAKHDYDLIYTHGNPYAANVLSAILKKRFNVPWIMYIGDPRYFGNCSQCKLLLRRLEKWCLNLADGVVVNWQQTLEGYFQYFPDVNRKKYIVISDGYDQERYDRAVEITSPRFRILYTGIFYKGAREPFEIIRAFEKLKDIDVEIAFAGDMPEAYKRFASQSSASEKVLFLGHRSYDDIVKLQKGADILLNLGWPGGYQLPGKMFDYLAAKRPILAVRYDEQDIASKIVETYRRGVGCDNTSEAIEAAIRNLHEIYCDGQLSEVFDLSPIIDFEWSHLSKRLEEFMFSTIQQGDIC